MFELKKLRNGVYHLLFDSSRELAMTFLRYQEFYESLNDKIRGKKFTLVEHMGTYVRDQKNDNDALWTYTDDFGGFNIPAHIIKEVHDLGIDDPNHYDALMKGIYGLIMLDTNGSKAYLIGTKSAEELDDEREQQKAERSAKRYLDHELTHAMFYLEDEYQRQVVDMVTAVPTALYDEMHDALKDEGYASKVAIDEINAYITTGESGTFDLIDSTLEGELDKLRVGLKTLHRSVFQQWKDGEEITFTPHSTTG